MGALWLLSAFVRWLWDYYGCSAFARGLEMAWGIVGLVVGALIVLAVSAAGFFFLLSKFPRFGR